MNSTDTEEISLLDTIKARVYWWFKLNLFKLQNILQTWREQRIESKTRESYRRAREQAIKAVQTRREHGMSLPQFHSPSISDSEDRYNSHSEDRY